MYKRQQLHTGGMCHLDAYMTEQGLNELFCEEDEAGRTDPVSYTHLA